MSWIASHSRKVLFFALRRLRNDHITTSQAIEPTIYDTKFLRPSNSNQTLSAPGQATQLRMTAPKVVEPSPEAIYSLGAIKSFMNHYRIANWAKLAEAAKNLCEQQLEGPSIPAVFSFRAKSVKSLEDKLNKLHKEKPFKHEQDIMDRVPDLAGVRIALYFPGQKDIVVKVIKELFNVHNEVEHPKIQPPKCPQCEERAHGQRVQQNRRQANEEPSTKTVPQDKVTIKHYERVFPGYQAQHLHVRFKKEHTPRDAPEDYHTRDIPDHMEIQIQSLVIHAWAEIEHDVWYKPAFREMNDEHRQRTQRLLDALNGHMMTAGLLLDQLDQQYQQRITQLKNRFERTYELKKFLHDRVHKTYWGKGELRLSMLRRFLNALGKDTEEALQPIIDDLVMNESFTPNTKLARIVESYSFVPVESMHPAFGTMEYILSKLSLGEESSARHRAESNIDANSPCYRLRVMLSSVLWLLDLSKDDKKNDALELCRNAGMSQEFIQSSSFKFLFDGADRTDILNGDPPVNEADRRSIDEAWNWFEVQIDDKARDGQGRSGKNSIFAFLHRISRMGVLRDLPYELRDVPLPPDDKPLLTLRDNEEDRQD